MIQNNVHHYFTQSCAVESSQLYLNHNYPDPFVEYKGGILPTKVVFTLLVENLS